MSEAEDIYQGYGTEIDFSLSEDSGDLYEVVDRRDKRMDTQTYTQGIEIATQTEEQADVVVPKHVRPALKINGLL